MDNKTAQKRRDREKGLTHLSQSKSLEDGLGMTTALTRYLSRLLPPLPDLAKDAATSCFIEGHRPSTKPQD